MAQRDTIIPVCKVVTITASTTSSITLANTSREADVKVSDTSSYGRVNKLEIPFYVSANTNPKVKNDIAGTIAANGASGLRLTTSAAAGALLYRNGVFEGVKMTRTGVYTSATTLIQVSGPPVIVSSFAAPTDGFTGLKTGDILRASSTVVNDEQALRWRKGVYVSAQASVQILDQLGRVSNSLSSQEANTTTVINMLSNGWYPYNSMATVVVRNGKNVRSTSTGGIRTFTGLASGTANPQRLSVSANGVNGFLGGQLTAKLSPILAMVPYVSVTNLSGEGGYFRVAPGHPVSSLYVSGTAGATGSKTNIIKNTKPSGELEGAYPGVIGGTGDTVSLTLPPPGINNILLENSFAGPLHGMFAINYGVIKQSSPLADQNIDDVR
tara:strand:- start:269 stop:1417 length:1149 start_codon:yes stop_codon:yes gene_type:complete